MSDARAAEGITPRMISRRTLLQWSAFAVLGSTVSSLAARTPAGADGRDGPEILEEATIAELQAAMASGRLKAHTLVEMYLARIHAIDRNGPKLRSILEINPDALTIARALDEERRMRGPRGPLHGIPVLLKDNIDTADRLNTTAGSLALLGSRPRADATVAQKLRDAGAVILGKANMSEWAFFRSTHGSSGWSARGGQGLGPYSLDRTPCGSSSGSGQAVAANLVTVALGTETDGSIVCPSGNNSIVGIKPTVGLTSRAGVIPIAHSQDTVGPMGRTVADAATVLGTLTGVDPRDPDTAASAGKFFTDYTQFLNRNALRGARIGIPRQVFFGYSEKADPIANAAIEVMRAQGAVIVDPANIPTAQGGFLPGGELTVLLYEFKQDLNLYLANRQDPVIHSLADLIAFNLSHAAEEMPFFQQEIFLQAQAVDLVNGRPAYLAALAQNHLLSRQEGIDAVLNQFNLDALVVPTSAPPWKIDHVDGDHILGLSSQAAALAGYPLISVPAGFSFGLPVGITFMGTAFSEPKLIALAYAFEQATMARRPPQFVAVTP
jgi:amidase